MLQVLWPAPPEETQGNSVPCAGQGIVRSGGDGMRPELEPILETARMIPREELPRLIGDLAEIEATALARLHTPIQAAPVQADELLDVGEAAQRLSMSPDYLYRNHRKYPFTKRMGRSLRFSSLGINEYIKRNR